MCHDEVISSPGAKIVKKRQSDSGVIRVHLPWIEQQITNGVRHEAIVEELAGMGFPMKLPTFRTGLVRERAKVNEAEKKAKEAAEAAGKQYQPPTVPQRNEGNSNKPEIPGTPIPGTTEVTESKVAEENVVESDDGPATIVNRALSPAQIAKTRKYVTGD